MTFYNTPFTLYSLDIAGLSLNLGSGGSISMPEALKNGRANYIIFEELVRNLTGLKKAKGSDHVDTNGKTYEQKSFVDEALDPMGDIFRTSSSSTFGANNKGPEVKRLLEMDDYRAALKLCKVTGYNKNDYYIYTNTGQYEVSVPFKYIIVPTSSVLRLLSQTDPRLISRSEILYLATSQVEITLP
jgi:hypothetical protein